MNFATEQDYIDYAAREDLSVSDLKEQLLALVQRFKEECITTMTQVKAISDLTEAEKITHDLYVDLEITHQHFQEEMQAFVDKQKEEKSQFINEIKDILNGLLVQDIEIISLDPEYTDTITYLTLFSKPVFHLTHKCICQQFSKGTVDNILLEQFKEACIESLINKK